MTCLKGCWLVQSCIVLVAIFIWSGIDGHGCFAICGLIMKKENTGWHLPPTENEEVMLEKAEKRSQALQWLFDLWFDPGPRRACLFVNVHCSWAKTCYRCPSISCVYLAYSLSNFVVSPLFSAWACLVFPATSFLDGSILSIHTALLGLRRVEK